MPTYFLNVNINVNINDYLCSMLLKTSFLLPHQFCNVEFEFSWFHSTKQSSESLILKIKMLLEFQNKTVMVIIGF